MSRVLVVATGGAGGDLQPLVATALALQRRGREAVFLGDLSVERAVANLGVEVESLPADLDLGPRLIAAIREAMAESGGDMGAAGPRVAQRLGEWAGDVAEPVAAVIAQRAPDAVITSLFGVEAVDLARPPCPWAVVNSTFYIGPNPPRPIEQDIGPRAIPLLARYARMLDSADLVLHATDQVFDLDFDGLPAGHHYVGPLGTWEPPAEAPAYLDEPGYPWVLVSISSQLQDDVPLAQLALDALADRQVRVLVTLGPGHQQDELSAVPRNARIEGTVSHSAVLERAALLVGHAGHGTVMKALWHGCPMVLVPWGRDQPGVAARAQALGVADVVSRQDATSDSLCAAIDRVLASRAMREACAREAARLQSTDPPARAAALVESLLRAD
jgi:UDP:flavonoid glycosyltransferase YjiC (YdhE family)